MGNVLKNKLKIFDKFCIPSPVVGGLSFIFISSIFRYLNLIEITMNTYLMDYLISLFFVTIGLSISLSLIKSGGVLLIKYWIICGVLAFSQNVLTVILSKPLNIHPLLSLMCGSISMEGGHGSSAAFGLTIENLGIENAISTGITASTFGLILAGTLGANIGLFLIKKHNLKSSSRVNIDNSFSSNMFLRSHNLSLYFLLEQILLILLCVSFGNLFSYIFINLTNIVIPTITGCIFVSFLLRNFNDIFMIFKFDFDLLDFLGEIFLGIFLTMALMSIDIFKLSDLLVPIIVLVVSQAIFIIFFAVFFAFKILGKNYDSAVMISGMVGHGLGATPVALANMNSLSKKYGHSEKAFLIVPLVAAFLLDIFSMPIIVFFINTFS
ncbi:MAG: sodium/glutamate symporter [Peptostreptococcaceae bacterium]